MKISLIICTYMRPKALLKLLKSVTNQSVYPNEILIIDGSTNNNTKEALDKNSFKNLKYFLVDDTVRGLTKQRNFGISRVSNTIDIVCFLDDDTILEHNYFENLIKTYLIHPNALGVGGYITNGLSWRKVKNSFKISKDEFKMDGYVRKMGQRYLLRKYLGLLPDVAPCVMPKFSNGYTVGFLPPSGKIYRVEYFMGGVSSFRKEVLNKIKFSTYFDGYGLYEDLDFCIRVSKLGSLYVNTSANLTHHHQSEGRPNKFEYGKMIIRNGWYVWRVSNPRPLILDRFKWNLIVLLLLLIRYSNIFTSVNKKEALSESLGRFIAWCKLLIKKPNLIQEKTKYTKQLLNNELFTKDI